uniref:Glycosyltransferase 2-like domain-containing protein n=1 Tax=Ditylum brightwellii TaxID=49249 RepID=A0A7S2EQ09_9STRA
MYVKFWIVVDNPDKENVDHVKTIATKMNEKLPDSNYFVNVIHYGDNRGASYARNTGYNYSTADWVLFLDDDIIPDPSIIDAYAGSIQRYPNAKVMVGLSELPRAFNTWTEILQTSNVMYFYGIANHRIHPPWGVTANLMVKGSRHNQPVQFKALYPKTGGGEDIDFVFQMKEYYKAAAKTEGVVVGVKGAKVQHPWWNKGKCCYKQINGWANGDSMCLLEWPEKTFFVAPNWVECIVFLSLAHVLFLEQPLCVSPLLKSLIAISTFDHVTKTIGFLTSASRSCPRSHFLRQIIVAFGGSTVISAQEITRVYCALKRLCFKSLCRRMDWFDGQAKMEVFDFQLRSVLYFLVYSLIVYCYYS